MWFGTRRRKRGIRASEKGSHARDLVRRCACVERGLPSTHATARRGMGERECDADGNPARTKRHGGGPNPEAPRARLHTSSLCLSGPCAATLTGLWSRSDGCGRPGASHGGPPAGPSACALLWFTPPPSSNLGTVGGKPRIAIDVCVLAAIGVSPKREERCLTPFSFDYFDHLRGAALRAFPRLPPGPHFGPRAFFELLFSKPKPHFLSRVPTALSTHQGRPTFKRLFRKGYPLPRFNL